jgi:hypothetical protein
MNIFIFVFGTEFDIRVTLFLALVKHLVDVDTKGEILSKVRQMDMKLLPLF